MSRIRYGSRLALIPFLFVMPAVIASCCQAQDNDIWQNLFDGRTLDGWDCDTSLWSVEQGVITGIIPKGELLRKNTWLVWTGGELTDFDLRLQCKLSGHAIANSGIQIRCQVETVDHVSGYQADFDQGQTWLGRIYDEHGRGLIVERGTRVEIAEDGTRRVQSLADAKDYAVLFRENDWNDYRIVGIGNRIAVFVNGTLFSDLVDRQTGQCDLSGQLAMQLHAGPETRVEFRDIRLATLDTNDGRLDEFTITEKQPGPKTADTPDGIEPRTTHNPLLHHLVPNPVDIGAAENGENANGLPTLAQMSVPKGFSVDVIAAEPDLHQPMAFTFDERGRLWVVEGHCYPQKRQPGEGLDRILIFADEDGDGHFESRKVFMEGLNLVSGLELGYGGVWIGAAPELLFIPDRNGDDKPDSDPTVLLDGFDFADTHETLNSFVWGPDGWLYGNQGVFNSSNVGKPGTPDDQRIVFQAGVWRYHPVNHTFEIFAHGGSNQWGLDYDDFGQWFMTHCRSANGKGAATHVLQGAHYWNQTNSRYAPFIASHPPHNLQELKNYTLASARYGHGEGGAGKTGSRAVYGGHSHVGTLIYLGDNWPAEYRNHLFTHNLHGHQMNHLVNHREAGGYNTRHFGQDMFHCADPQFVGVELKYGPDGAVYFSDWYDPRHCHHPGVELWDRGNGRLYRMKYDAAFVPAHFKSQKPPTDAELASVQLHANDWYVRTARRMLAERHAAGTVSPDAVKTLRDIALTHEDPAKRLRGIWALNAAGAINAELAGRLLNDDSEYVRGWTVQLAVETLSDDELATLLPAVAENDSSLLVRRYLASAIQRVPNRLGWKIAETLASQPENSSDRDLPLLLWFGIAPLSDSDPDRALKLADVTAMPEIRTSLLWYTAKRSPKSRNELTARLAKVAPDERLQLVSILEFALRGMRGQSQPDAWSAVSRELYETDNLPVRRSAERLGSVFGDADLFRRMRALASDPSSGINARRHALQLLAVDSSSNNLPAFLQALSDPELAGEVLPILNRFDDPSVAKEVITRLPDWKDGDQTAAVELLSGRPDWALPMLDAMASGDVRPGLLSAFHVRQISGLNDERLNARLSKQWGVVNQTSAEKRAEIDAITKFATEATISTFDGTKGEAHFKRLCAACHLPNEQSVRLGPNLAGTGARGTQYMVENIVDPNAVVGRDYQARIIVTTGGQVITGLIESETDSAITVRTATNSVTVNRDEIEETRVSENSFMPEGLLRDLSNKERMELLIYLYFLK